MHKSLAYIFIFLFSLTVKASFLLLPMDETTQIGPLARIDLKEKLLKQVEDTLQDGAKILYHAPHQHEGTCFYPPTILGDIPKNSIAYAEELFGPVLSLYIVHSVYNFYIPKKSMKFDDENMNELTIEIMKEEMTLLQTLNPDMKKYSRKQILKYVNTIRKSLTGYTAAAYKSLLQKLMRFGAPKIEVIVNTENKTEI